MARTVGSGRPIEFPQALGKYKMPDRLTPRQITYFRPFKGINTTTALEYMEPEYTPFMQNLQVDRGTISSRFGLGTLGAAGEQPILTVDVETDVFTPGGAAPTVVPVRWTTAHVQVFTGGAWTNVFTYPNGPLTANAYVPYTNWAGTVVFYSPDTSGLYALDPIALTVTVLGGGLLHGFDVATFGNRIISSCIPQPTSPQFGLARLNWSVKNDDNNWTGIGSGFEDMISLSGTVVDEVMGVRPVTDQTAIVVRAHSIWRIDITGYADAPFQTALLINGIGTEARYTVRSVPGGVAFLGYDDVYVIGLSGVQRIGDPLIKSLIPAVNAPNFRKCYAYFDSQRQWYWLTFGGSPDVYIYTFRDKLWFKYTYPLPIYTIDGTFQVAGGGGFGISTAAGWPTAYRVTQGVYVTSLNSLYSMQENPSRIQDVDASNNNVDSPIEIRTGLVRSINPLHKVEIIEAQLEYESSQTETIFFDYSVDGGNTWQQYSQVTINQTTMPEVVSVRKRLETARLQIRVRTAVLGGPTKLRALHLFVMEGALIHP